MPKISVIMSVYNTKEEWLRDAIESILNQTFADFEFIIINDGSTNNVEDVILSYKDDRIKYIKQENQGLANSLNNGLEIAKGEYIARMDSDDISLPERFEKQINFFEQNKDISVLGTWFEMFPNIQIIKHPSYPKYLDFVKGCYIGHPTVMFRRSDFEKYGLKYNPDYKCEDYELWSRAIRYLKFANLQEVLLRYRWHENNLSKPTEEFLAQDKKVKQNMLDWLTDIIQEQEYISKLYQPVPIEIPVKKPTFLQQIFSVRNEKNKKVIRILGIKIKSKKCFKMKIVKLMGGLGNQMFQYAFGKALEKKTNKKVLFDNTWFEETKKEIANNGCATNGVKIRTYDLDFFPNIKIEFADINQINLAQSSEKYKVVEENPFIYDKNLFNKVYKFYVGYFQNEKYLENITKVIKQDFEFPEINSNDTYNQNLISKIKSCENPVFIHIRRGDYLNLEGWTLSNKYYKNAVKKILKRVENPTFFIFGQDCEDYIKKELQIDCNYEYVGNHNSKQGKDYIDMQLMTMCKHGIIANSTFSWWAAWLLENENKIIIAPTPWLNDSYEIICKDWVKVEK